MSHEIIIVTQENTLQLYNDNTNTYEDIVEISDDDEPGDVTHQNGVTVNTSQHSDSNNIISSNVVIHDCTSNVKSKNMTCNTNRKADALKFQSPWSTSYIEDSMVTRHSKCHASPEDGVKSRNIMKASEKAKEIVMCKNQRNDKEVEGTVRKISLDIVKIEGQDQSHSVSNKDIKTEIETVDVKKEWLPTIQLVGAASKSNVKPDDSETGTIIIHQELKTETSTDHESKTFRNFEDINAKHSNPFESIFDTINNEENIVEISDDDDDEPCNVIHKNDLTAEAPLDSHSNKSSNIIHAMSKTSMRDTNLNDALKYQTPWSTSYIEDTTVTQNSKCPASSTDGVKSVKTTELTASEKIIKFLASVNQKRDKVMENAIRKLPLDNMEIERPRKTDSVLSGLKKDENVTECNTKNEQLPKIECIDAACKNDMKFKVSVALDQQEVQQEPSLNTESDMSCDVNSIIKQENTFEVYNDNTNTNGNCMEISDDEEPCNVTHQNDSNISPNAVIHDYTSNVIMPTNLILCNTSPEDALKSQNQRSTTVIEDSTATQTQNCDASPKDGLSYENTMGIVAESVEVTKESCHLEKGIHCYGTRIDVTDSKYEPGFHHKADAANFVQGFNYANNVLPEDDSNMEINIVGNEDRGNNLFEFPARTSNIEESINNHSIAGFNTTNSFLPGNDSNMEVNITAHEDDGNNLFHFPVRTSNIEGSIKAHGISGFNTTNSFLPGDDSYIQINIAAEGDDGNLLFDFPANSANIEGSIKDHGMSEFNTTNSFLPGDDSYVNIIIAADEDDGNVLFEFPTRSTNMEGGKDGHGISEVNTTSSFLQGDDPYMKINIAADEGDGNILFEFPARSTNIEEGINVHDISGFNTTKSFLPYDDPNIEINIADGEDDGSVLSDFPARTSNIEGSENGCGNSGFNTTSRFLPDDHFNVEIRNAADEDDGNFLFDFPAYAANMEESNKGHGISGFTTTNTFLPKDHFNMEIHNAADEDDGNVLFDFAARSGNIEETKNDHDVEKQETRKPYSQQDIVSESLITISKRNLSSYSIQQNCNDNTMENYFHYSDRDDVFFQQSPPQLHDVTANIGIKPFECSVCSKAFFTGSGLQNHVKLHACAKTFEHLSCGKSFSEQVDLEKTIKTHSQVKPFESSAFSLQLSLLEHVKSRLKKYKCPICSKSCYTKETLKNHIIRIHSEVNRFQCQICGKVYFKREYLQYHVRTHTGEKPFKCLTCGKSFSYRKSLKHHTMTHTGENAFKCSTCGKTFSYRGSLQLHSLTHTGIKPFECKTCGKAFSYGTSLKVHTMTHTGETPFECLTCGKTFCHRRSLRNHTVTHTYTIEKPYQCQTCGKTFSYRKLFKNHTMTHTGEKPLECPTCGKAFSYRKYLHNHIMTHTEKR